MPPTSGGWTIWATTSKQSMQATIAASMLTWRKTRR